MKFIRNWKKEDAFNLAQALNNKKIQNNLRDGLPFPYSEKDAESFIQAALNSCQNSQFFWAIQKNGKAIGSIGISRKENIHYRTAELGYYLAELYWGQGIMTNAIKEACSFIFDQTNIIRIFAEPYSNNIGSCKALQKAGFQLEGILRKNAEKNGQVLDMKLFSLIKD